VIAHLESDYSATIVSRSKRDYVWIMARTPSIPEAEYKQLAARVVALGYSLEKLRKVPQRWPKAIQP
jgi:apolipoprotein D and lipocalin family protein